MAEKETIKQKKIKELLSELASNDDKRQLKAVKSLKVHGNETVVKPLLVVLTRTTSEPLKAEITDVLNTIKFTAVPPIIASALLEERFAPIRQVLLASVWNSGLDYSPFLTEIVTAATQGEMMDALECITIIENIEQTLTEDQLFDPLLVLKEYFVNNKDESGAKTDLLKEIAVVLQNMNDLL